MSKRQIINQKPNGDIELKVNKGGTVSDALVIDGATAKVNLPQGGDIDAAFGIPSYRLVQTLLITSNTTFTKATYPWLRALRVKCVGGGGAGGGGEATALNGSSGGGGGAGAYSESWITDIAGLAASVTVTIGAAGAAASGTTGGTGGDTSFGATVIAKGGSGGTTLAAGTTIRPIAGGSGGLASSSTGTIKYDGHMGLEGFRNMEVGGVRGGIGGGSILGGGAVSVTSSNAGISATTPGSGGSGAANGSSQAARSGGAGAAGICIIELFS